MTTLDVSDILDKLIEVATASGRTEQEVERLRSREFTLERNLAEALKKLAARDAEIESLRNRDAPKVTFGNLGAVDTAAAQAAATSDLQNLGRYVAPPVKP